MTFQESNRQKVLEEKRAIYEEEVKKDLKYLHGIADGTIFDQYSVAGYIDENLLHRQRYNLSPLLFILEYQIKQTTFERLRSKITEKTNTFPRLRSEIIRGKERFIMRITPSNGDAETRAASAYETTLQLQTDWENNGFLLVEVPHPDLPARLQREFTKESLMAEEILDVSILLHTPPRKNSNTFKSADELMAERMETAESLAKGFQDLAKSSATAQDLIGEMFQRSKEDERDLGSYPSDEECGMTEENYWYFTSRYGEHGVPTDPKDIELQNRQWEALQRRMAHDMRMVRRIRNSENN